MGQKWEIVIKTEGLEGVNIGGSRTTSKKAQRTSGVSTKDTSSKKRSKKVLKAINSAKSFISNSGNSVLGAVAKAVPPIAVAVAITTSITSVVDVTASAVQTYTGQTGFSFAWTNTKKTVSNIFNPISFAKNSILTNLNLNKQNEKLQQQRELVGNSITNNSGKGV